VTGAAFLTLVSRHALPIGMGMALLISAGTAWHFRAQRDAARLDAATATRVAEANAATLARATAEHERHIAALTGEAERARAQAARLGADREALRRDPSHAAGAAPVLRAAVERLRASRGARDPAAAGRLPDALLVCTEAPALPSVDNLTQGQVAELLLAYDAAHADCAGRLAAVRRLNAAEGGER